MIHQDIFEAIADAIASRIAAKLGTPTKEYTSGSLPIGVSKRTFARRCAQIAGARREGRIWRCLVDAWHASYASQNDGDDAYATAVRKAGAR
jgi:hypothetical protein